jgi:hypothetical protein
MVASINAALIEAQRAGVIRAQNTIDLGLRHIPQERSTLVLVGYQPDLRADLRCPRRLISPRNTTSRMRGKRRLAPTNQPILHPRSLAQYFESTLITALNCDDGFMRVLSFLIYFCPKRPVRLRTQPSVRLINDTHLRTTCAQET